MGVLTRAFPPDLVDVVIETTGTRSCVGAAGQAGGVLRPGALTVPEPKQWLWQVMAKLADGLYHRRRGVDLLAGQLDPDG